MMSMFWLWHEGVVLLVWIRHNSYRNVFCHYVLPGIASVNVIVHRLVVAYMVLQTFPVCEIGLIASVLQPAIVANLQVYVAYVV